MTIKAGIKCWLGIEALEVHTSKSRKLIERQGERATEMMQRLGMLDRKSNQQSQRYDEVERERKIERKQPRSTFFHRRSGNGEV